MARLIHQHAYPTLRFAATLDISQLLLASMQVAVLGGIAVFVILAIVNSVLGTPPQEPAYTPYQQ